MTELFASAIRLMTPVGYPALGEVFSERAGVMNVGLEGYMLVACFFAALTAAGTGSVALGIVVAAVAGAVLALVASLLILRLQADQIVVGVGINLVALGLTSALLKSFPSASRAPGLDTVRIPVLARLPVLGPALFDQRVTVYLLVLLVLVGAWIATRTSWGLAIQACGENPAAADVAGLSVNRLRLQGVVLAGALSGLGGAALSIGEVRGFAENMTAGRGFIALASVVFGRWRPTLTIGGCLLFGLADALRFSLPGWGVDVAPSLLFMLPYVVALLVLLVQPGDSRPPAALGEPFVRRR